jgi:hypothetical protein
VSAPAGAKEPASHLLDEAGEWKPWEGGSYLEPYIDAEAWDRLMVRTYARVPFLGYGERWRCFALVQDGAVATLADPEGESGSLMVPLFHDSQAAETFRSQHRMRRARVQPVADLVALVREHSARGVLARLHPGDHRARGATLWLAGDDLLLDGFAGIWRSRDGRTFSPSE